MNENIKVNTESSMYKKICEVINNHYKAYRETRSHMSDIIENLEYFGIYHFDEEDDESNKVLNLYFDELENDLYKICSNKIELCNYVVDVLYRKFQNKPKSFLWCLFGDVIVDNLKNKTNIGYIPIESKQENSVEYLGRYYQLVEVSIDDNI